MTDEQIIPVEMNIVVHELNDSVMVEPSGPFASVTINIPRGEIPALVCATYMELRAVVWDFHYKSASLRAIYDYQDGQEVHLVYNLKEMVDNSSSKPATVEVCDDPVSDKELAEEYTMVWAAENTELEAVTPTYGD